MAKQGGVVTLRGRFRPGTRVRLVQVAHEGVLRAEGGDLVAAKKVDGDGVVQFTDGVEEGGRYFIVGQIDGEPHEVRVRANAVGEEDLGLVNHAVDRDRTKLADGTFSDEIVDPRMPRSVPKPAPKSSPAKAPAAKSSARARKSTTAKSASSSARKGK